MKSTITDLLKSNTSTIIYGMSGWGKSQIIKQSAEALGMNCQILSLAGVAPEDFGIPTVREGYYEYLPPKWAYDYYKTDEDFVLFLDEITQATIQVMHAIYPLVLEKRIGGLHLPNMRIIAASNYDHENPNLTTIMKPLLNRFDVEIKIEEDFGQLMVDDFWDYILNKYPAQKIVISLLRNNTITTNPRAYESGIRFIEENPKATKLAKLLVLRKAFGDLVQVVMEVFKQDIIENETDDDVRLKQASFAYLNKVIFLNGLMKMNPSEDEIVAVYNLSNEEKECVFI